MQNIHYHILYIRIYNCFGKTVLKKSLTYSIIKAKSLLIDRDRTLAVENEEKSLIPLNISFIHFKKMVS